MQETQHRSFQAPDETRKFPNGQAEILGIGNAEVGRLTFQPGWRWSNDVKPLAGTSSCEAPHFQYHVSGRLAIRMDDGSEFIAAQTPTTCGRVLGSPRNRRATVQWCPAAERPWKNPWKTPREC